MTTKVQKKYKLDLSKVPEYKKPKVKREVSEYLEEEMLVNLASGKSIVKGETFKKLSKPYADAKKSGNRTPNLLLDGDMLDSLTIRPMKDDNVLIKVSANQNDKADGHCNFSGQSKLPRRRFIPGKSQGFKPDVEAEVKRIIKSYSEQVKTKSVKREIDPFTVNQLPKASPPVAVELDIKDQLTKELDAYFGLEGLFDD